MARVIVFGIKDFASLANFYLREDSDHQVEAFCVEREYLPDADEFEGLPVVPFEEVASIYPPGEFAFFAPMSSKRQNRERQRIFAAAKRKQYDCVSYVSSRATVLNDRSIGENCFVLEDNTIQPFTTIGDNCILWSGNHIGHHSRIESHVFISSHVVISGHCVVEELAFLGVNATVRDAVTVGEGTFVAMSAAIAKDTEPWSIYRGAPAVKSKVKSSDWNP